MAKPVLVATGLAKSYASSGRRLRAHAPRPALVDVSLELHPGRTLGIVGESGSGKTTLARCLTMLERPDHGAVWFDGADLTVVSRSALRRRRRRIQIIFQDPSSSLNPRFSIANALGEVLSVHNLYPRSARPQRILQLLDLVGISPSAASRHPSEFSGGQQQRICIARALAAEPEVVVADEAVSALDVSIQAQILNLLVDLQAELGIAMLFISHNIEVVRYIAHDVGVMFGGRLVERIPASHLDHARHPYTGALLKAVPRIDDAPVAPQAADYDLITRLPAVGCPYRSRCQHAHAACETHDPPSLRIDGPDHEVACHWVAEHALTVTS